jgi:hypothetical protein
VKPCDILKVKNALVKFVPRDEVSRLLFPVSAEMSAVESRNRLSGGARVLNWLGVEEQVRLQVLCGSHIVVTWPEGNNEIVSRGKCLHCIRLDLHVVH